ncbi:hypothetical protein O6H91_03G045800 [Diphasiastrum complanatum]|uniref:Uncharacterized protein n=1 Tax=Diphasiastrum complanatum TaxID=34168 RepID=A0ACC2E5X1_DIPCM|nr:hypothetical protein O6H91_03G045800 [Diphasiastrum complanatum]
MSLFNEDKRELGKEGMNEGDMEPSAAAGALSSPLPVQQSVLQQRYVRGEDEQPKVAHDRFEREEELPVIDLAVLACGSEHDKSNCRLRMLRACQEWGFFRLVNHSLPIHLMRQMDAAARRFFSLSLDEKLENKDPEGGTLGYCSGAQDGYNLQGYWQESLQFPGEKDTRKAFLDRTMQHNRNDFRDVMEEYCENVHKLAEKLTEHLAVALGLPSAHFSKNCSPSVVRFSFYPPCPDPASTLGVVPHTDAFVVTILQQDDVSGLQILKDGNWITVRTQPDTLIVNVGDMLQIWSNDILSSVVHRVVVNSESSRLTTALFFGPIPKIVIQPHSDLATAEHPLQKFRPFTFEEYMGTVERAELVGKDVLDSFRVYHTSIDEQVTNLAQLTEAISAK